MSIASSAADETGTPLVRTALHALHVELGARMVPFAGYEMPVQYRQGVLQEHLHTRAAAGLFDVSHMGQLKLIGADIESALEALVPVDIVGMALRQQRYALLTDANGGILDDLMITRTADHLFVVVNAACKVRDIAHLRGELGGSGAQCDVVELDDHALLALQGPAAAAVMERLCPDVDLAAWTFMTARSVEIGDVPCFATRSGYTGEDGFELSIANRHAEAVARLLLAQPEVAPVGLGARDSLRLEAGLCLYGHDIDRDTTPIEGSLLWSISKARRADGERAGGFPGAERILGQIAASKDGLTTKRVGLVGVERTPVREGSVLVDAAGGVVGRVTSGTFGPTVKKAVALGYVAPSRAAVGTPLFAMVRGRTVPMHVAAPPFVPSRYYRG